LATAENGDDSLDDAQLERYARDVKEVVLREREQAAQLEQLMAQVQVYATELRTALESEHRRRLEIEDVYDEALMRLGQAIALRHHEKGRLDRLSHYCEVLCRSLSLSELETRQIAMGAQLHDIGEIGISDEILFKPGPLTEDETATMRWHCWIGANLLRGSVSPLFETARQIALTHHERWNGMGYPHALSGTEIPLCGRIVMLADVYDALRNAKPCKPALPHAIARKIILEGNGRLNPDHFDPDLLASFERSEREFDEIFQRPYSRR
jgi:putative two-component system response regulator